jgi:hypothetical protein
MSRLWSNATNLPPPSKAFDGETYSAPRDFVRLTGQWLRVFKVMRDGEWRSLNQIKSAIFGFADNADSESAISARLRDFRKPRWGAHTVERRHRGAGLWEYRLLVRKGRDAA